MTISPDESEREHSNVSDVPVLALVFDSDAAAITMVGGSIAIGGEPSAIPNGLPPWSYSLTFRK
jgi:hypothetical protein